MARAGADVGANVGQDAVGLGRAPSLRTPAQAFLTLLAVVLIANDVVTIRPGAVSARGVLPVPHATVVRALVCAGHVLVLLVHSWSTSGRISPNSPESVYHDDSKAGRGLAREKNKTENIGKVYGHGLKILGLRSVPVQVRPRVPLEI